MRDSKFLKVDDNLIAEAMSVFSAPPVSFGAVTCLVQSQKWPIGFSPSLELVNSEEEDKDFKGGEDKYYPYPLGDFLGL